MNLAIGLIVLSAAGLASVAVVCTTVVVLVREYYERRQPVAIGVSPEEFNRLNNKVQALTLKVGMR